MQEYIQAIISLFMHLMRENPFKFRSQMVIGLKIIQAFYHQKEFYIKPTMSKVFQDKLLVNIYCFFLYGIIFIFFKSVLYSVKLLNMLIRYFITFENHFEEDIFLLYDLLIFKFVISFLYYVAIDFIFHNTFLRLKQYNEIVFNNEDSLLKIFIMFLLVVII